MKVSPLGDLEQKVMDIVWSEKQCSAREVVTKLQTDKKLAYTTVATILQRLCEKGLLFKTDDRVIIQYLPKLSKEEYSKKFAKSFLEKFIHSFGDIAIASFAESIEDLPDRKREYFLQLLKMHVKNK